MGSNAPGGSDGWHQALTMPLPSFTPPRVAGLSLSPRTPPYPRAWGQGGTRHPWASSARGGAELGTWLRGDGALGAGSHLAATGAPAQPRQGHGATSPRQPGGGSGRAQPLRSPGRCPSPGCRQSTHNTRSWQGESRRGSGTHLSRRAGTSRRAARPWPCWSWQRPWHHPRLEAERGDTSAPLPQRPGSPNTARCCCECPARQGHGERAGQPPGNTGSLS